MAYGDVHSNSQLYVLKLEISHGSDRHDVSIYSHHPPTVDELLSELEKKTRVPKSRIQLIYKGQRLHLNRSETLKNFGIFTGSRILMVGEKLGVYDDALFRRILGIGKDVGLIEKNLKETMHEYSLIQIGSIDRTMAKEYLPQMHQRVCSMQKDLETFLRVLSEISLSDVDDVNGDISRTKNEVFQKINNNVRNCQALLESISSLRK